MRQRGFTLIEMVLAIAIFSMISLAAYSVLDQVQRANLQSEKHGQHLAELQRTFWWLQQDVLQMSQRQVRIDEGEPRSEKLLASDSVAESDDFGVAFTRQGWQNPFNQLPRGTVQAVWYRVQQGKLERLHTLYPDAVTGTEPKVRLLSEGITQWQWRFYDGKTWQSQWGGDNLPQAVEITLTSDVFGKVSRVFLTPSTVAVSRATADGTTQ